MIEITGFASGIAIVYYAYLLVKISLKCCKKEKDNTFLTQANGLRIAIVLCRIAMKIFVVFFTIETVRAGQDDDEPNKFSA